MKQITSVTNASLSDDGAEIHFDILTKSGGTTYALPVADLGRLILFFTGAATAVAETNVDCAEKLRSKLFPIPITGLELRPASTAGVGVLAVNVAGFWLGFEADAATFVQFLNTAEPQLSTLHKHHDGKLN